MEFTFQLFLSLAVIFVPLVLFFLQQYCKDRCSKLPPGTTGLPVIGETVEFGAYGPEKFIRKRMKKYSEVAFKTSLLGEKMAVFCGPSGNKFLFSSGNNFLPSWWPEPIVKPLSFPHSQGKTMREVISGNHVLIQEFLRPDLLQDYIPIMDSMSIEHLDSEWAPFEEVKVYPLAKKFTCSLACTLFLGIKDRKVVNSLCRSFSIVTPEMVSVPIDFPGMAYNKAMKAGKVVKDEILKVVRERKKEMEVLKSDAVESLDLLSGILRRALDTRVLNDEKDIATIMAGVLLATYDDTSSFISFLLKYLAELPHIYNQVYEECMGIASSKVPQERLSWNDIQKMKYSWNVACEVLRLVPPFPGTFREVTSDLTYDNFTIPKGWKAFWSAHTTHKNPKYFPDPEKFDPSRFEGSGPAPYTFVPFGGGSRICPGREYVRLEILVFMYNVVTRFKMETIIPNERIMHNLSSFPEHGLPVRLLPLHKM